MYILQARTNRYLYTYDIDSYLKVNLGAINKDETDFFYFQILAPFSRKVELFE